MQSSNQEKCKKTRNIPRRETGKHWKTQEQAQVKLWGITQEDYPGE